MKNSPKKIISILTPVLATAGTVKLLPETIASVLAQKLPADWGLEWIVVEDGKHPKLANYQWPSCVRYHAARKQVYEVCARTLALSMAKGDYVVSLDADDMLPKGALFKICQAYDKHPEAMWVAGQEATPRHHTPWINRNDLNDQLPIGLCKPGLLYPFWLRTGQFAVTFQCSYRAKVLWEFGGYPAMPYTPDVNLLLAISSLYPGMLLSDVIYIYRRWPGQMTARKSHFVNQTLSAKHVDNWIKAIIKNHE